MNSKLIFFICLLGVAFVHANAVEQLVNGVSTVNLTAPTSANIPNWDTGWGSSGVTGWDYVGNINGSACAIYLGNNWVITAAHVGAGTFVLGGTSYNEVPGSAEGVATSSGTADLTLFQVAQAPDLPSLLVDAMTPNILSDSAPGDLVAMIGNGGGKSWGLNTITAVNVPEQIGGFSFNTTDFETAYGATTTGSNSATNHSVLIVGDSGGAGFIYDSVTGKWVLAGIGEKVDDNNDSFMIQLSAYSSQIKAITAVPEPGGNLPAGLALALLIGLRAYRSRRSAIPAEPPFTCR